MNLEVSRFLSGLAMAASRRNIVFRILLINLFFLKGGEFRERVKRDLKFPKGASIALSAALATHYPNGPLYDGLNQVLEFDFGFPLPEETVQNAEIELKKKVYKKPPKWSNANRNNYFLIQRREKRNSREIEKENLLSRLENIVTRLGYNGSACVSRFQCDLRKLSPENSFVEELLIEFFQVENGSEVRKNDCDEYLSDCPLSILHILLHSQQNLFSPT